MLSPLSEVSLSKTGIPSPDDVYKQVLKLSKQVTTVIAITTKLEAQLCVTQTMIAAVESKVEELEAMLKAAEEAWAHSWASAAATSPEPPVKEGELPPKKEKKSLMVKWMKFMKVQWSSERQEWMHEPNASTTLGNEKSYHGSSTLSGGR